MLVELNFSKKIPRDVIFAAINRHSILFYIFLHRVLLCSPNQPSFTLVTLLAQFPKCLDYRHVSPYHSIVYVEKGRHRYQSSEPLQLVLRDRLSPSQLHMVG